MRRVTLTVPPSLAPGTYYLTVVAENASGVSAPSNEALVTVGSSCTVPGAPISFSATSNRDIVTLSWAPNPSGGAPAWYLLEVGSTSGAADLGVARIGVPGIQQPALNGTYYVRVRGENACGIGPASDERVLVVSYVP